jgi:hypothetical protein
MMQILAQRNLDANNFNAFYTLQNPCQLSAASNCIEIMRAAAVLSRIHYTRFGKNISHCEAFFAEAIS